jgi:NADH-quinone oxidoreductase subunit C/D
MVDHVQAAPQTLDLPATIAALQAKFGEAVKPDTRKGYEGIVVSPDKLLEVSQAVRDEYGYNYLSSLTAVDYLGISDHMEVVYHAFRLPTSNNTPVAPNSKPLVIKAQTNRAEPTIPSVVSVWPGADFQEREAYDLYGIHFPGHPNLKRILLWDGFDGHPMRKDWREAYYEQERKPFDSRWPGGQVFRAEEFNPFGHNVRYPAGFNLDDYKPQSEAEFQKDLLIGVDLMGDPAFNTDRLVVNMGPHHPSTHGVFRMMVTLSGETVEALEPVMGYLHRNHEKIGERNTWMGNIPFTDRLDYISSMCNNHAYAMAVERLMGTGVKVPYRAEVIRVLMAELTRITNHLWAIGFLLNDLGAFFTPALYAIQTREYILDFFEATAGARMMCNYMRFGGVFKDVPERIRSEAQLVNDKIRDMDTMEYLRQLIFERLPRSIDELDEYLSNNEIIASRTIGVGVLPAETAIAYSTTGPLLRASGVPYDIRRAHPYSIYPELEFDVVTRPNGDLLDRYFVRLDEMRESMRILKQVLPLLEKTKGESIFGGKTSYSIKVPEGESYGF